VNAEPGTDALWHIVGPMLAAMPRITAAVSVAPLFPSSLFPLLLRSAVVVALSLHLYPYMSMNLTSDLTSLEWLVLIGKESFIGVLLGFAVGTLMWAFECVGAMIDFQVGFSNAPLFDPFGGHDSGPIAHFMLRLGVVLFVAGGGLQVLSSLLFDSYILWPVASFYPSISESLVQLGSGWVGGLVKLSALLAVAIVLLLALVDVALGLVNRVVPQLNVFFLTMPIKGALAALMIALYLTYLIDIAAGKLAELPQLLERLAPVLAVR
jgi:type III secretion protein T